MSSTGGALDIMASWVDLLGRESLCVAIVFTAVVVVRGWRDSPS